MADTTLPGVLLTGDHASRPAANTVAGGTLYACSTHDLLYQSDTSSWSTWATLGTAGAYTPGGTDVALADGGTGASLTDPNADRIMFWDDSAGAVTWLTPGTNLTITTTTIDAAGGGSLPGWVSWFIGTTDSTHFYWDGNDLAGFTSQTVSGSATWAESENLVYATFANQTTDDCAVQLIAQTFSIGDAWILAVNSMVLGSDSGSATGGYRAAGIVFADGTTSGANCVIGHLQIDNGAGGGGILLVGRDGTLTNINSAAPWVSIAQTPVIGGWIFIKLIYQASNTFRLQFGLGPGQFSAFGESDISFSMTPTHVGLFVTENNNAGTGLATFGPLKKV